MQRGRKSAAALAAINVDGKPTPPQPPAFLNEAERNLFIELVNAVNPRHFVESDLPLLVSYVQATLMSRQTAGDPDKVALWEKAVRVQAMLATRLRLAPQARIEPKTLGRWQTPHLPRPWEIRRE